MTGCSTIPKTSAVARSGCWSGISRGDAAFEHRAHGVDRVRCARRELAQLPVLHEEQEAEEGRVLVVRVTEAANHRREPCLRRGLGRGEGVEPAGELDVVPFEGGPDELVLADEMAIEGTLRDIDRAGDISNAGLGHALFDEEPDGGLFDAIAGVGESMSRHGLCFGRVSINVSKRLFTL